MSTPERAAFARTANISIHEDYVSANDGNDIALLLLDRDVDVEPVAMVEGKLVMATFTNQ